MGQSVFNHPGSPDWSWLSLGRLMLVPSCSFASRSPCSSSNLLQVNLCSSSNLPCLCWSRCVKVQLKFHLLWKPSYSTFPLHSLLALSFTPILNLYCPNLIWHEYFSPLLPCSAGSSSILTLTFPRQPADQPLEGRVWQPHSRNTANMELYQTLSLMTLAGLRLQVIEQMLFKWFGTTHLHPNILIC